MLKKRILCNMDARVPLLLVDDDEKIRRSFELYLGKLGYGVESAGNLAEARGMLEPGRYRAVLLDYELPDGSGIDFIPEVRAALPGAAVVVITGNGDIPSAVAAMKNGANNFLTKPVDLPSLNIFLRDAIELERLRRTDAVRKQLQDKDEPFHGDAPEARQVRELAGLAAENDAVVLLQGETGTGKGVLARWIYRHSARSGAPFVEINCSGLQGDLFASELFGHIKGAFTSAVQDREGLIEAADGGTLFLDEIGDMDPAVQARFLKALEEKTYRRVGEVKTRHSDFRLICATNRDLDADVASGRFRQDLLYRINTFPIVLPALRDTRQRIPDLAGHMLAAMGYPHPDIAPGTMAVLQAYEWPGNIRELKNMLERASLLARKAPLEPRHFPGLTPSGTAAPPAAGTATTHVSASWDLKDAEKRHILAALQHYDDDVLATARALGLSRSAMYRKLEKIRP